MEELIEGQIVMCTVEKIIGTTIFVKIHGNGEGTITTSEIAPGRIRNLRDYVVPGKRIICKILRIDNNRIHLSLRRVKQNEKKELLNKISTEKSYKAILKTVLGKENYKEILDKINQEYDLSGLFEEAKKNQEILKEFFSKEDSEKILKILNSKKEKVKQIKQHFNLSTNSDNGIIIIKDILNKACKDNKCEISYLAAGKYTIKLIGEDFKEIKSLINKTLKEIETLAKQNKCEFSVEKP